MTKLDSELEERLWLEVKPLLEQGRPGWDLEHTLATVHWMKELIKYEGGDEKILVTTMYLHDIGYSGLFKEKPGHSEIMNMRDAHMQIGAIYAREILNRLDYTPKEIEEIVHLIGIHDNLPEISKHNEIMVMEADSLGQIDRYRVGSTFSEMQYIRFIATFNFIRVPRFKTDTGKKNLEILLPIAKKYINKITYG